MCIRDSDWARLAMLAERPELIRDLCLKYVDGTPNEKTKFCLLYTSDAADERSSVDLGGRRIIKKKNNNSTRCR